MRRRKPAAEAPELSRRIRADREAAELSQEQVARRLGISLSAYRNYERIREPKPQRLRQIALAFGLPEDHYVPRVPEYDDVLEAVRRLEARQEEIAAEVTAEVTRALERWMQTR